VRSDKSAAAWTVRLAGRAGAVQTKVARPRCSYTTPIKQVQMTRLDGERWRLFGRVISGEANG